MKQAPYIILGLILLFNGSQVALGFTLAGYFVGRVWRGD